MQNCNQFTDFKHIPSLSHSFKNTSNLRGFVITLESCSCVLQCTSSTVPSLVKSRKKWNFISICLLLPCMTGFFDNFMAKLLSQKMIVHLLWIFPSFSRTRLNQTPWHAQYAAAMNSASVVDRVTTGCFFEDQETGPVPSIKMYPEVFFLSSMSPA